MWAVRENLRVATHVGNRLDDGEAGSVLEDAITARGSGAEKLEQYEGSRELVLLQSSDTLSINGLLLNVRVSVETSRQ